MTTRTTTVTPRAEVTNTPTTAVRTSGRYPTIADYITDNGITETPVKRGDPGTPMVNLPTPQGWADAGPKTPQGAYGAILTTDPSMAADPASIVAVMSRLTGGGVAPTEIFKFAPGELKNLPGYESAGDGGSATLGGFDAFQIGATYVQNGIKKLIAQKTVVIPAADGDGIFVLQLNASGNEDQINPMMDATAKIDEQTTITP